VGGRPLSRSCFRVKGAVPQVTAALETHQRKPLQIELSSPGPDSSLGATLESRRNTGWRPKERALSSRWRPGAGRATWRQIFIDALSGLKRAFLDRRDAA
jgi:hypothetical protein